MSLPATGAPISRIFDVQALRAQFPLLSTQVHGQPLVYLDNAATTQKPLSVIEAVAQYYRNDNANVHRGVHALADRATALFESARARVAAFLNSPSTEQIIFTRGTTESINLVAQSWARSTLRPGDEILVSGLAHHSNIVPWQMIAEACAACVRPIPVLPDATLDLEAFAAMLGPRTRLVALEHVSNAMGTIHPLAEIVRLAREAGARVLVDGAQSVSHLAVDVQALDVDFYAFSGHKMYGPTGIGVLWGRRELLEAMPPWQGGGEMIETVSFERSTYASLPYRFEAGTPHIAGAVGLGAAVDFLQGIDRVALAAHEEALLARALDLAASMPGFRLLGAAPQKIGVLSFLLEGAHPHDVGTLLDRQGIAVRTGHHCAQPAMASFGVPGTVRASFALYNTLDEVDRLFAALEKVRSFL
jgi:cysteine desulfurase/selenocysteine lyase